MNDQFLIRLFAELIASPFRRFQRVLIIQEKTTKHMESKIEFARLRITFSGANSIGKFSTKNSSYATYL